MGSYCIDLTFSVRVQGNGDLFATCDTLPILLVAKTQEELEGRLGKTLLSVSRHLSEMDAVELRTYLEEHGVTLKQTKSASKSGENGSHSGQTPIGASNGTKVWGKAGGHRTVTVPVAIGA